MGRKKDRQGLTVVVTGASSGFGKGIAEQLAADGANVVLAARRTGLIEELAAELGDRALAVTTDVSKQEEVARLMAAAESRFGKVDVWINNAGLGIMGSFTDVPLDDMLRLVDINLKGMVYGSHCALRHFKENRSGTLINMSSFISSVPLPFGAVYCATKYGIAGLTAGLHLEMEMEGWKDIHVCMVHPWVTDTPWPEHSGNYSGHEITLGPVDAPETVIAAVIDLIDRPQESVEIGIKSKAAIVSKQMMPHITEKLNGALLLEMLKAAPIAKNTSGSIHSPRPEGIAVSGNMRNRLKQQLRKGKQH
ncbi:SDR family NAD(P)-dependent oxidoreductase [Microbacterium sp. APC 3898]|uniref:SDR family NAD(P)-dependent oxidoreductase n=1 Tax=Planococcus notacanthi TaxID=3035188 RepID=A0ABT7ZK25_9BACL|nr:MULTISPECIES: SDR family NAD(P)-dependent oxidoreductase [Terrabacteria group]MDN3427499.1 SDR family NAD(P)-dependent oxidoreductase [Planococcus sp. APC 4016]MDN3499050.1 SDR family NAD(P)-dependent oxidoreductase [Microbacterium sp. APC 3898]